MALELLKNYAFTSDTLTNKDYDYIYISPHLDDVAFSCGGSICAYKAQGFRMLVVTLFAGDPRPPFPPLAQVYHQLWQVPEGIPPYQTRKAEDERAMAALGVDYVWLNWLDVIYRAPELSDFSEINDSTAAVQHDPLFPTLCQWLIDLQTTYPNATILVPLGIGEHRDHRMVFQAAFTTLDHATLLFFEDFPYVAYLPEEIPARVRAYNLAPLEVDISQYLEQRIDITGLYQSQHAMLFYPPSSFRERIRAYARAGEQDRFIERYWRVSPEASGLL
jgi:LmbE family N-acetylglucosaminyl deacetylase